MFVVDLEFKCPVTSLKWYFSYLLNWSRSWAHSGEFYHLSKMSLQETVVPGGLRSELCLWGVKSWDSLSFLNQFFYIKKSEKITFSQIFWHMHLNNRTALKSKISRCNNSRITCSISMKLLQNIFSNLDFANVHLIWSYNVVISLF